MTLKTDLHWTPFPGHWPGQKGEDRFFAQARYRGMEVTLFQYRDDRWEWAFYDPNGGPLMDPDLAIATDTQETKTAAIEDVLDYIDGYVAERHGL